MRDVWFAIPGDIETLTGGYAYARQLMAALPAAGWRPRLLSLPSAFPCPSQEDLSFTRSAFEALPTGSLVMVDGLAFGAMPRALLEGLALQIVALVHHPLALETGLAVSEAQRLRASERGALAAAQSVIVTSAFTAETLVNDYSVPRQRLFIALPGTQPAERALRKARVSCLLTVATLTHRKGYDTLIQALAKLTDLPWTCVSVGSLTREPATAEKIQALARQCGVTARIEFRGELSGAALEAAYIEASIFLLPSRYEGYGMVFAEALAHGLPVVACNAGAVTKTVPHDAGLLVPPDDADALAAALRRLLTNTALCDALSDAAWRHGQNLPRWSDTAANVATALQAAAS